MHMHEPMHLCFVGLIDSRYGSHGHLLLILGFHHQSERFRIESTGKAFFDEKNIPEQEFDTLDIHLKLDASQCIQRDVISFTVIVSEQKDGNEYDRRGLSTVVHIV